MRLRPLLLVSSCLFLSTLLPLPAAELRGAWVASVYNLNFPTRPGLSEAAQKAEIRAIVQTAASCRLNALMVQVRPEGDALYDSPLEPWSRYLTGTQGAPPGYDPLQAFILEGTRSGIGIHAWINPFRAATNARAPRAGSHEVSVLHENVRRVGSSLWLDPGSPEVRSHIIHVVRDIARRYAVAGIILDDYFYPYPGTGLPRGQFPDAATYRRYHTGQTAVEDWRRQNVDDLISSLSYAIKAVRPGVLFGVSPFGIYTRGQPATVHADLDQYRDLYADPVKWLQERWVDYLSPQLYWRDESAQSYSALLRWWRDPAINPHSIPICPSIALERLGAGYGWPASEIGRQLQLEASIEPRKSGGFILWNVGPLLRNQKGCASVVAGAARPST